jgi:hypothetical protein
MVLLGRLATTKAQLDLRTIGDCGPEVTFRQISWNLPQ